MRIFKSAWFNRFCRKQRISDKILKEAVARAEKGQIDADLGGGVLKLRIARQGQGKSGGYRAILLFRARERAFFVYGYAKNHRPNIAHDEEVLFKKMASHVLELSNAQLTLLIENGQFSEV